MTFDPDVSPSTSDRLGTLQALVVRDRATASTVRLVGELDLSTAGLVAGVARRELDLGRRAVTLDIAGLDFVDSTGLHALVAAHRATTASGGTLAVTGIGPRTARLLDLTGLDATLTGRVRTSPDVS